MKQVFQIVSKGECGFSVVDTKVYTNYEVAIKKKNNLCENYPEDSYWVIGLTLNEEEV